MPEQQEVRILTVRQPWAWAIIHGGKDVENRGRNIAGAYRGPVAIHAAMAYAPCRRGQHLVAADVDFERDLAGFLGRSPRFAWPYRIPDYLGAILGVVDLVDVVPDSPSPWAQEGQQHLVLTNPRPIATPIPYRGALGLRKLPADIAAAVLAPPFPPIGSRVTRTTTRGGKHTTTVHWEGQVTHHLKTKVRVRWDTQNGTRTVAVLDHYPHEIQEATP